MVAAAELLLPVLGAALLAGQALTVRMATRRGTAADVLVVTLLVNVIVVVPLALLVPPSDYPLTTRSVAAFVAAGIAGTVLGRLALYTGIKRVGASRAEPVKGANPLFAALAAVAVLGERLVAAHAIGIVLIAAGVAVLSWERAGDGAEDELGSVTDLGFPLLAALLFGVEPIFAKIGLAEGTPYLVGAAIKVLAAAVGYLGYLRWRGALPRVGTFSTGGGWYLAVGLFNTAFLIVLYAALSVSPVVVVAPLVQASPLFVVVASYVFLQELEVVNRRLAAGAVIVVIGGGLVAVFG